MMGAALELRLEARPSPPPERRRGPARARLLATPQEHRQPPGTWPSTVTGVVSGCGLGAIGDGESRSPLTAIPHTGPLDIYRVVPGAHFAE
jgi:hypothetical protein